MIDERVGALLSIVTCSSASFGSSAAHVQSLFNDELQQACDMIAKLIQVRHGVLFLGAAFLAMRSAGS